MLKGIKIIDFTHRLPGPLAGKILSDLGAEVIKIEDIHHKDPFLSGMFSAFDKSFENWYEELNKNKQLIRLDFKAPEARSQIRNYLKQAQGLMLSLSPKLKNFLGLTDSDLQDLPIAVVELEASSSHNKAMHDLNALAISGFLSLHTTHETKEVLAPPFMPIAGIAFGQQVATQLLANVISSLSSKKFTKSTSYLLDTTQSLLGPFWPKALQAQKKTKFLHNGAYPCYSLYRTKDGHYVALAAVEEKFWGHVQEEFLIALPLEKRFETSSEAFDAVSCVFANLSAAEIEQRAQKKEMCLSIVRTIC